MTIASALAASRASSVELGLEGLENAAQHFRVARTEEGAEERKLLEWLREQAVSVTEFGVEAGGYPPTNTEKLQKAIDTGRPLRFPGSALFYDFVGEGSQLNAGQYVFGDNSGNFASGVLTSRLRNLNPGGGILAYTDDTVTYQRKMPRIEHLSLTADYPVRFNNETTAIVGDGSNVPFGMKAGVIYCDINPRVYGTGIGISWSKMFNGVIQDVELDRFGTNILLNGCDLSRVEHNRSRAAFDYHILELSCSTFSSQNKIEHNEMLGVGSADCIAFKTTARHAWFVLNYIEVASGTPGAALKGFIDVSSVNAPAFAGNTSGGRYSARIAYNRLEGKHFASDFIYRYEPGGQHFGEIIDLGSTGAPSTAPELLLCDATGAIIDRVPFLYSAANPANFRFSGAKFGKWNGYESECGYSFTINGRNLLSLGNGEIAANNAYLYLNARGNRIVFLNGFTTNSWYVRLPTEMSAWQASREYVATVRARAVTGSEDIKFAKFGSALVSFALSNQMADYSLEFTSSATATDRQGLFFGRTNNGNEIEIESITIAPKYQKEQPFAAYSAPVDFTVSRLSGSIDIFARNDGGNITSFRRLIIHPHGVSVLVTNDASSGDLSVTTAFNVSTKTLTVTLTGGSATKNLRLGWAVG